MASTVNVAGRNLPPPQSPFVNAPDQDNPVRNYALSFDGYQFLINLLNLSTSALSQATVSKSLIATGTNQATALQLNSQWNEFDTVPVGSGALLSAYQPGQQQLVINDDPANALLVYPPPGGTINQLNPNVAFSLAANSKATFLFITALEIRS
jgi:hypothetical protein